jgi:hypothetical protein
MSDDGPARADDAGQAGLAGLDDSALIARRREIRDRLEREPPDMADLIRAHHLLSTEVIRRTAALRRQAAPGKGTS